MPETIRVLNLTGQPLNPQPNWTIHTEPDGQPYDKIVTWMLFSQLEWSAVPAKQAELKALLAPGGELHLHEPSGEYAARELLADRISVPLLMHLYGDNEHPHRMLYTMLMLRRLISDMGLMDGKAETVPYKAVVDENEQAYYCDLHFIVGINGQGMVKQWIG